MENTLSNTKKAKNIFEIEERPNGCLVWIYIPIAKLGDLTLEFNEDVYDLSTNLQNKFNDTTEKSNKKSNIDRVKYEKISKSPNYENCEPKFEETRSSRYIYKLEKTLNKMWIKMYIDLFNVKQNPMINIWKVKELKKCVIPSNKLDIYTKLELLLGIKYSGHTNTLNETSHLIDELYKGG